MINDDKNVKVHTSCSLLYNITKLEDFNSYFLVVLSFLVAIYCAGVRELDFINLIYIFYVICLFILVFFIKKRAKVKARQLVVNFILVIIIGNFIESLNLFDEVSFYEDIVSFFVGYIDILTEKSLYGFVLNVLNIIVLPYVFFFLKEALPIVALKSFIYISTIIFILQIKLILFEWMPTAY